MPVLVRFIFNRTILLLLSAYGSYDVNILYQCTKTMNIPTSAEMLYAHKL